jgi:hypothetical protein
MARHRAIRRHIPVHEGDAPGTRSEDMGDMVLTYMPLRQRWVILMGKHGHPAHTMSVLEMHSSFAEAKKRFDYIIPAPKHRRTR